jgi:polysaccharide export outer membrane protein
MEGKSKQGRYSILGLIIIFLFIPLTVFSQSEQSYQVGSDDVLEIKFWQDRTLDAVVKVRQDGKISLDIAGEIDAAGLTTSDLEKKIVKQISRYNSAISQAVVRVIEFNSRRVFVSGQIRTPGRYTFEKIPDLWTIINEAGGVTEFGDLTRVLIIRGGADAGKVEVVNVSGLVTSGKMNELPKLRAGDTIEIPRTPAGLPAPALSDQSAQKNLFYIVGEVINPGSIPLEKNTDLLDGIALAGGPSEFADLRKVTVISKDGLKTQTLKVNLKRYQESGRPGRYFLRPEDTIILQRASRGFLGIESITGWVAVIAGIGSVVLIADRLGWFGLGEDATPTATAP